MNTVQKMKRDYLSKHIVVKLILFTSCYLFSLGNMHAQKRDFLVVEYLQKTRKFAYENKRDSTIYYMQKAEKKALGNPDELFRVYSRAGMYFFREDFKLDSARVYLKKMQKLLPKIQDDVLKAKVYNKTGYFFFIDGQLGKAYEAFREALKINFSEGTFLDAGVLATTYIRMARLYAKFSLYAEVLDFAEKSITLTKNEKGVDRVSVYRQIGWIQKMMGNYYEALKFLKDAERINKNNHNKTKRDRYGIIIKRNIAEVYYEIGDKRKSLKLILESIKDAKKAKVRNIDMSLYLLLSKLYNDQGNFKEALKNGLKAYDIAVVRDLPGKLAATTKQLENIYENTGDSDLAYYYVKKYNDAKSRVEKEEGKSAYLKEELKIAKREFEEKMQAIESKAEMAELNTLLITVALIMSIGFGFLFYRRKKIVFLQQIAKKEKVKYKIQQQLKEEKEKVIAKEEELKVYMKMLSDDSNTSVKNLKEVKRILNELRDFKILTENDWTGFKSIFQNVYPNFFKNFKIRSINYSQGDLKLAALVRLNFNTKEIAEILVISPDSVRKSKYRLRKKMNFTSEEELQKFIHDL